MNYAVRCLIILVLFFGTTPLRAELDVGDMEPMPNFRWVDADGKKYQLKDFEGQPIVLHFWAAWCIPCRHEMPGMVRWRDEHPQYKVLALSLDDRIAQTEYFLKKNKFDMPALLVHPEDTLMIPVVPYSIFITKEMKFAAYSAGAAVWADADYRKAIATYLEK